MPESKTRGLNVAETVVLVNRYLQEARINGIGRESLTDVAERLGWTIQELSRFRRDYAALLNYDDSMNDGVTNFVQMPPPVLPPTGPELMIGNDPELLHAEAPTDEQLSVAVEAANQNLLQNGLMGMGFSAEEAVEAEALQKFNATHFKESMEIVASNGMRTSMKLATQQRHLEERLKEVRERIAEMGGIPSDERNQWVSEERLLMRQYAEFADLINRIQDTWFRGTAALAVAKMRMRNGNGGNTFPNAMTQRSNKPGFRPTQ